MAVDVLGDGVNHDIGTVVQRVLNIGAQEGVINHDQNTVSVCNRSNLLNIDQAQGGVGRGFNPDQFRLVGADQFFNVKLDARRKGHMDAMGRSDLGKIPVGSTVDVGDGDDVRARCQGLEDDGGSCGTGGEGESIFGVFESSDGLLKVIPGTTVDLSANIPAMANSFH